ncbi:hypothetical protein ACSW29_23275 [Rhodococcus sp. GB-02]
MTARAVIFAPALPIWDEGASVEPIRAGLDRHGIAAHIVDTNSLAEEATSIEHLAELWAEHLSGLRFDLVCGNALGGAVATMFAVRNRLSCPVLTVSGPVRTSPKLSARLTTIINLAASGGIDAAMVELHAKVTPAGEAAPPTPPLQLTRHSRHVAARRIATGLSMLRTVDLNEATHRYPGRIVSIVGTRSQLVGAEHTADGPTSSTLSVAGAGMRPHHHNPTCIDVALTEIRQPLETSHAISSSAR